MIVALPGLLHYFFYIPLIRLANYIISDSLMDLKIDLDCFARIQIYKVSTDKHKPH